MGASTVRRLGVAVAIACLVILAGCGGSTPSGGGQGAVIQSALPRNTAPSVSPGDLATLVAGNTAFASSLYQATKASGANVFLSPYSISLAFSMLYAGAQQTTAQQIAQTFHFTLDPTHHHAAFDALELALASRSQSGTVAAGSTKPEGFHLSLANALFGQKGFAFEQPFLDTLAVDYGAGLHVLDFAGQPDPSRQSINNWVANDTNDTIRDLLPPGSITAATRFVLANAVYFLAAWDQQFNLNLTAAAPFQTGTGGSVSVSMMHETALLGYAEGSDYQAVDIAYDGGAMSMLVILPAEGQLSSFEASLNATNIGTITGSLTDREVELSLPKFTAETSLSLGDTLAGMGMTDAFSPSLADFSGIDGAKDLSVSAALHKAFVTVDEAGTEAGAATAIIGVGTAMPGEMAVVTVNRPFVFLIRDRASGTVLFMGRVTDPSV